MIQWTAESYPTQEIVLINGRPWQETEWADEYLALLPAEARDLAKDPTINGWLKEATALGMLVEQLRAMPRGQMPVSTIRYKIYRTVDDFLADGADFQNGSKSKEDLWVPASFFFGEASDSTAADTFTSQEAMLTNNRIHVIMRLNDPKVQVTNFIGTPYEYTGTMMLDQPPIAPNGHTLIPVRAFANAFGIGVKWNPDTNTVRLSGNRADVYITAGFVTANVISYLMSGNVEQSVPLSERARLQNGCLLIPLRFLAETFGFQVDWDGNLQQITIEGDLPLVD